MEQALITGATGQDGARVAEWLLSRGYRGHGMIRRAGAVNTDRIERLDRDPHGPEALPFLRDGELTDGASLCQLQTR